MDCCCSSTGHLHSEMIVPSSSRLPHSPWPLWSGSCWQHTGRQVWTVSNGDFKGRAAASLSYCMVVFQEEHILPAYPLQQSPSGSSPKWSLTWLLVSKIIPLAICNYWNLIKPYHHHSSDGRGLRIVQQLRVLAVFPVHSHAGSQLTGTTVPRDLTPLSELLGCSYIQAGTLYTSELNLQSKKRNKRHQGLVDGSVGSVYWLWKHADLSSGLQTPRKSWTRGSPGTPAW